MNLRISCSCFLNSLISIGVVLLFFNNGLFAQIQIGTGTEDERLPIEPFYRYSYSQVIYLQSEINAGGVITEIKWYFAGDDLSNSNDWTIYLGHTTKTEFSSGSDWIDISSLTEVWSGTFPDPVTVGWITFDITDFNYNNSDNLVIAVDENASGYNSSSDYFNSTSVSTYRGIEEHDDYDNIDPTSPPSSTRKKYIANIILEGIAQSCPSPSDLTESSFTQSSVDLSWTETGSATTWDIEYGAAGFSQGTGAIITGVTTNPYNLSGLSANLAYEWYVRSDCGSSSTSTWSDPGSFYTCINSFPWSEDFENIGNIPYGWTQGYVSGSHNWIFQTGGHYNENPSSAHGGTYNACFDHTSSGTQTKLISPQFDLNGQANPQLSFWHTQAIYDGDQDELRVYYKAVVSGSWTLIAEYTSSITSWTQEVIDLPNTSSTYYIAFEGYDDYGYGVCVDDVEISVSECPASSSLYADNITQASADLNWTSGGATTWNIEWGEEGFTQSAGIMITGTNTNPYSLNGLDAGTSYDFYVQDDCGGGSQSSWSGPFSFTTICDKVSTFPWTEDFENEGTRPGCWTEEYCTGSHDWAFQEGGETEPYNAHGGSYNAAFIHQSEGTSTKLITPPLNLSLLSNPQLSFWFAQVEDLGDQDELRVYYRTSLSGSWTMIPDAEYTSEVADWTEVVLSLPNPSDDYYIAFEATDGYGQGVCIDDVEVDGTISCLTPTNLFADNISASSVDLNWTTGGASTWNIEWGAKDFIQGNGTVITGITTNPYTLSGLSANSTYDFYVQDDCGGSQSTWSDSHTFCTVINNFPWSEDFENSGDRPDCWTEEYVSGDIDWSFIDGGDGGIPAHAHGGLYNAEFSYNNGNATMLITPVFDIAGLSNPALEFWHYQEVFSENLSTLSVYYRTSESGSWTLVPGGDFIIEYSDWTKETLALPSASTTYQLAFKATDGGGYGVCLDDIRIMDNLPMTWVSSTCTQNTDNCFRANYQQIIGIEVVTENPASPIEVSSFEISVGSSSAYYGLLKDVRVYYTGTSSEFSFSNLFNISTVDPPDENNFDITGSQLLQEGTNYFWLTLEVQELALPGDNVDAECFSITTSLKSTYVPDITSPEGYRVINNDMTWTGVADNYWSNSANWNPAGPPDISIPVVIPNGTTHNLEIDGSLAVNGTGLDFSCYTLEIESFSTVTHSGSLYVFGKIDVDGSYTNIYNVSNSHWIYGDGEVYVGTTGILTIGNSVNGEADLRIGHGSYSGGTLVLTGGDLIVADQLYLHSNATIVTGSQSVIFAGKGGGGSVYSVDNPATLFVESGAIGNIRNTTLKVCGKTSENYHSVNIQSTDFNLSNDAVLEICHGDYATHYNTNIYAVDGVDLLNVKINKTENIVSLKSNIVCSEALSVEPNSSLTIDSDNTVSCGQDFVLESSSDGTASLINNGIISIGSKSNATVQRYIRQYSGSSGWHFLASPVMSQLIQPEFVTSPPKAVDDFYFWDETNNYWFNSKDETGVWNSSFDNSFVVGKGYMVAYSNDVTKVFTGDINTVSVSPGITYSPEAGNGWNLVGNPFPCAIDWDDVGWTKTNISGSVYIYDGSAGQYKSWNGSTGDITGGIIPSMNGFFVLATDVSPALTIPLSSRTHNTQQFYKSGNMGKSNQLVLSIIGNGYSDKAYIDFRDDAKDSWDIDLDAYKLMGIQEAPQLFTYIDGAKASINSLPLDEKLKNIDVGLKVGSADNYSLCISGVDSFLPNIDIKLFDLKLGVVQNLRNNNTYKFEASGDDELNRFRLGFYDNYSDIENVKGGGEPLLYVSNDKLFICFDHPQAVYVSLFDLSGRHLMSRQCSPSTMHNIQIFGKGLLIVKLRSENMILIRKILR